MRLSALEFVILLGAGGALLALWAEGVIRLALRWLGFDDLP